MKTIIGFILVFAALLTYHLMVITLGYLPRVPWLSMLISSFALGLMAYDLRGKGKILKVIANLAGWGLSVLFYMWVFVWSSYGPAPIEVAKDRTIPSTTMTLPLETAGVTAHLGDVFGDKQRALLVIFRGHW